MDLTAEEIVPLLLSHADSDLKLYPAPPPTQSAVYLRPSIEPSGEKRKRRSWASEFFGSSPVEQETVKTPADLILSLPPEIIEEIAECLPRSNLVALSMTCRAFRYLIWGPSQPERNIADALTYEDYLEYLYTISRGTAGQWVCTSCDAIHETNLTDTPTNAEAVNCPSAKQAITRTGKNGQTWSVQPWLGTTGLCLGKYHLGHRHVQTVLKYNRLGNLTPEQKRHFHALMSTYRQSGVYGNSADTSKHEVQLEIVAEQLLVLSTWSVTKEYGQFYLRDMDGLYICPHLQIFQEFAVKPLRVRCPTRISPLRDTMVAAMANEGLTQAGSCESCPIDYTVLFKSEKHCEIRAWFNCGGELVCSQDDNWRALSVDLRGDQLLYSVQHTPGIVRLLFDKAQQQKTARVRWPLR
ncbi:hypothetical protein NLG97_g7270 [Lecanicillium saksenae]|uniref:Uncharacterized protein n=1 Tax=Lecanicillium saksenae TaxID=468837 RepID=A0ACC1QPL3_9HYPO|nr:hypothetical protein NLG97_g7270 [Lecanicillium saksenae]